MKGKSDKQQPRRPHKGLKVEALEPRILMSATWVDPATGEAIEDPTAGDDRFEGDSDANTADGLGGNDVLLGNAGDDILQGNAGDDILQGGAGDDTLDGGADTDVADYRDATGSIRIDITDVGTPQDTGGAGVDTLYGIEGVLGSDYDDTFGFRNPIPGQTYTVDGGNGFNTVDLSSWDRSDVTIAANGNSLTVDLGSNQSFSIELSNVSRILTADVGEDDAAEVITPPTFEVEEGQQPTFGLLVVGGDPDTMTWSWSQTGGTTITLDDPSAARPTATIPEGLVDSTATFDVTLTSGSTTIVTNVDVQISADNDAANITASDLTAPENSLVQISATVDEPEAQPYLYTWTQVSGPAVTLNDSFTLNPSFTAPELAANTDIVFELAVTDGTTTATQQITVTVQATDDAPTANAGADITVAEDSRSTDNTGTDTYAETVVTLNGSASDPEGQALTYTWRQTGGPAVTLDDANAAQPSFTVPQGTEEYDLQFELTVSDGTNVTTDTVTVTVEADEDAAVVDSLTGGINGADDEESSIQLAISAYDPEGTSLTYTWRQVGGDPVVIADPSAATTTFTATNQLVDTYVSFEVDVTDESGTTTTKQVTVLVTADNDPPTTDLGADRTVGGNTEVVVTTTASDPEGLPLAHYWTQTSGPAVAITGQGSDTLTVVTPTVTETTVLTFQIQTMDGVHTVTDTISITVDPTEPEGSGSSGGAGGGGGSGSGGGNIEVDITTFATTNENDSTDLSIDVTSFSGPGPLTYSWTQVSGESVAIADATTADASFTAPELTGTQILGFQVEVSDGETTITEIVFVTVVADNDAPTVDAGPPQSVTEEGSVTLSATDSDPEGKNLAGRWEQVSGPVVEIDDIFDPNATVTTPNVVGNSDVVLRWIADDGENVVSDTVTITILADDDPPEVDAGPAATIPEASNYTLNPSVTDPEGLGLTYTWTQVSGPTVTLDAANIERPSFDTPNVASDTTIEFQLTVSDGTHTVTDNVVLTIAANDDPPEVDAGDFQSVDEGDVVTLNGTASDPEGQTLTTTWTQIGGPSVTLSDANALNPTFTAPNELANTYVTFRIDADDGTTTVSDTVTILINADNDAPTNNAGSDQTVSEGSTVNLSGTATDPEGQALTHRWVQVSGPPVTLTNSTGLSPTFEAPNVLSSETIVFQLETTDGTYNVVDTVSVTVTGVNDAPQAIDGESTGVEDDASITVIPTGSDPDYGDEIEAIRIETLPSNGTLMFQGNPVTAGDVLDIDDINNGDLTFEPDADYGGNTTFAFRTSDGDSWSVDAGTQTLAVDARADVADLTVNDGAGDEDTAISVPASVATTDADGSETIRRIQVRNAPDGSVFSDGVNTATYSGGNLNITSWDLSNLTVTPPQDLDLDFTFQMRAQTEDVNGSRKWTTDTVNVEINPINDAPYVSSLTTTTTEDTDVAITLSATEVDTGDAAEMYRIESLPDAADGVLMLNGGAVTAGTTVTQAEIDSGLLRFEPADDVHGTATFDFSAYDGELWSTSTAAFTVTIAADADAPSISAPISISGDEDQPINLPIAVATTDTDGSESITNVSISSVPAGATVTDGVHTFTATSSTTSVDVTSWTLGDITITAPPHSDVDFSLQVSATSTEASNSDTATTTQTIAVEVDPVVDEVNLPAGSTTTTEDTPVNLGLDVVFQDNDGSESHVLVLGGLPDGATITDGDNTFTAGGGINSIDVGNWDLTLVTITPPTDSDGDFQITVTATTTEADGGATDSDSGTVDITVTADADAPSLTTSAAAGTEDSSIDLSVDAQLTDTDGSESLTVAVSSIPVGATLTDGANTFTATVGTTSVDITSWNQGTLSITPPGDSDQDFTLIVTATSTEANGGDTSATIANLPVTVTADADAPTLTVTSAVSGLEDTPIDLTISTGLTDTDGSESIDLTIEDVPAGATLTDGVNTFTASGANTTADITGWDLGNLTVQAPPDSDADFTLQVVSTTTESANGDTAETRADIDVTITAVTDDVGFSATDGVGNEDTAISFSIAPTLGDTDGSETLDVQIGTIPVGATVTDGVNTFTATNANTSFDASTWNFSNLSVTPPADDASEFTLQITSTATESSTGATSTRTDSVNITVTDVADAPTLTVSDASGTEDSSIDLAIGTGLTDTDGSESLTTSISQIPVGATLTDGANTFTATVGTTSVDISTWTMSSLSITPPTNSDVEFDLVVTSTATEADGGNTASTSETISVTVASQTDSPTLATTDGSGAEDSAISFGINANLVDTDGSETLDVIISNIPIGVTISDGANTFTATAIITSQDISSWNRTNLTVTPPADSDSDFTLTVTATSTDTDGDPVTVTDTVDIVVAADADASHADDTGLGQHYGRHRRSDPYQCRDVRHRRLGEHHQRYGPGSPSRQRVVRWREHLHGIRCRRLRERHRLESRQPDHHATTRQRRQLCDPRVRDKHGV